MPSEETKLEVLHAHYLDTFANIRNALRQRDRLFAYTVIAATIMLLQVVAPQDTDAAIGKLVSKKLDLESPFSLSVIGTVLWFAILGLTMRYFQTVIYIERQYTYIHSLEEQLAANYRGTVFTREGKSYLGNYPLFSKWTNAVYTIVFPAVLVLVLTVKLSTEFRRAATHDWLLAFDTLTFGAVCVSVALYLASRHCNK
jgi:hypothetical protein